MLKLQPNPTFKVKIAISVAGEQRLPVIEVEYRYLTREGVQEYFENLRGKTDAESLAAIVVGWSGVDAAYSPEALAALLNSYPAAAADLFEAFRKELLEAKRKN